MGVFDFETNCAGVVHVHLSVQQALFQKAMHITKSTAELAWIAVLAQQHVLPVRLKLNNFY